MSDHYEMRIAELEEDLDNFIAIAKEWKAKCDKLKESLTALRHRDDFKTIEEVNNFIDKALGEE